MILEVKNGHFSYGNSELLNDINFKLDNNEVMTILGPNGAGKTTLLKCVMDFLHWKTGETYVAKKPLRSYDSKVLWKKISYVPQAKRGAFSYRVLDMVVMGLDTQTGFFSTPKKEHYDLAMQTIQTLGIEALAHRFCNHLSGGELQMVMIARALVSNPDLLILDEPESNLDMKNQLRILDAIERAVHEFKTACLMNTHFPNHALNISNKTLLMGHNNTKVFGDTRDLISEDNIKSYFGVQTKILSFSTETQEHCTICPYKIAAEI